MFTCNAQQFNNTHVNSSNIEFDKYQLPTDSIIESIKFFYYDSISQKRKEYKKKTEMLNEVKVNFIEIEIKLRKTLKGRLLVNQMAQQWVGNEYNQKLNNLLTANPDLYNGYAWTFRETIADLDLSIEHQPTIVLKSKQISYPLNYIGLCGVGIVVFYIESNKFERKELFISNCGPG